MRQVGGSALVLGAVAASVLALAPAGVPVATAASARVSAAAPGPALQLVSQRPLVALRGIRFVPREAVVITVIGASVVTGKATVAADGSFRSSLRRPPPLACGRLLVRATGTRGSRASLRVGPPECNPTGADPAGADPAAGNR